MTPMIRPLSPVALEVEAVGPADALELGERRPVGRLVGLVGRGGEQGLLGLGHLPEDLLLRIEVVVEGSRARGRPARRCRRCGPRGSRCPRTPPWPPRAGGPGSARPSASGPRVAVGDSVFGILARSWSIGVRLTVRAVRRRRRDPSCPGEQVGQGRAVVVGEGRAGPRPAPAATRRRRPARRRGGAPSCRSSCSTASAARRRPGRRRAPTSGRGRAGSRRNSSNAAGSKVAPPRSSRADHHPVADRIVGHGVDRDRAHVGVAGDDRLDRAGGEVLAVDPQPVVRPAGEEQPAVGVAVGEVARPVGAVAEALAGWPPRCGSSPRSPTSAAVSTISPTASSRFVTRPLVVEDGAGALLAGLGVEHLHRVVGDAERARRASTGRGG